MAKCPFAVWMPLEGSPGSYVREHPFKIVHHTTEGSSADGAFTTYHTTRYIPHFTVDNRTIYQHADIEISRIGTRRAGITATSTCPITSIGTPPTPKRK